MASFGRKDCDWSHHPSAHIEAGAIFVQFAPWRGACRSVRQRARLAVGLSRSSRRFLPREERGRWTARSTRAGQRGWRRAGEGEDSLARRVLAQAACNANPAHDVVEIFADFRVEETN